MDAAEKEGDLLPFNENDRRPSEIAEDSRPNEVDLQRTRTDRLPTAIELRRTRTELLQYQMTVGSQGGPPTQFGLPSGKRLSMGLRRAIPPKLPDRDAYLVDFDGPGDQLHPFNWKLSTKLIISCVVCFGTFQASFASAIFAAGSNAASSALGVSPEVGELGTTLYVLGFASGPMLWAPASELIGRRWPLIWGIFGHGIFVIASAVAKDIQTLLICRFFSGVFGASQLSIVPAVLADIYDDFNRGRAIAIYSLNVFVGPFSAPFIGGFIANSSLGWRWTLYVPAFMAFLSTLSMLCLLKETYAPAILVDKAATIRRISHNWAIHAKQDEVEVEIGALVRVNFLRPLRMLATEPVLLFITLYMSFVYALVYAFVEALPYVFETVYGMHGGVASLPFIGLIIGQLIACLFILSQHNSYARKLHANGGIAIPEWRLSPTLIGAPAFAIGLFWFSWTGFTPSIHWMAPTAAGCFIGFGVLCIFLPCFNYLVDAYLPLAASTVAANIMARSAIAAGFPLFTRQMFANLHVQWAGTLLACLATVMIPLPLILRTFGPSLRKRSKLAISESESPSEC